MKKILNFLQWQWKQLEVWQKCWMLASFLIGAGVGASEPYNRYLLLSGAAIILGFMLKWAIWDSIRNSWTRYNEEQEKIVSMLKDGVK
jgi:hypothetical protein